MSDAVSLPEKVDLIVSDLRGTTPMCDGSLRAIQDARSRFLREGGSLIPARDELWACLVDAPSFYQSLSESWATPGWDLDLSRAARICTNSSVGVSTAQTRDWALASEPQRWARIDYAVFDSASVSGELSWTLPESRTVSGLLIWFTTELVDGIGYSAGPAPCGDAAVYGQLFLPWPERVSLERGWTIQVDIDVMPVGTTYVWIWKTAIEGRSRFEQCELMERVGHLQPAIRTYDDRVQRIASESR